MKTKKLSKSTLQRRCQQVYAAFSRAKALIILALASLALAPYTVAVTIPGRALKDICYTGGKKNNRQSLDLYLPTKSAEPYPLIIFIHGGGWYEGDKSEAEPATLLGKGYAVASINYRLVDAARYPSQIYDCKAAVRWLRTHAKEYNINADKIGVWGQSAGGYLAAMLGTTGGVKQLEGTLGPTRQNSAVQAVVDWYGPTDFQCPEQNQTLSDLARHAVINFLGQDPDRCSSLAKSASPVTYADKSDPPFLIMHGNRDMLVPISQSKRLDEKLRAVGVESKLIVVENAGHEDFSPAQTEAVFDFFDKHLKSPDLSKL